MTKKTPALLLAITTALVTAFSAAQTSSIEQRANLLNQIRDNPTSTELHYQLGALELFTFGDPDAAAFHYATATTTGERYDTLHNEAVAHAQAGRYWPAVTLLRDALERNPSPINRATTLELLGDVLHTAQDYEEAAAVFEELHALTQEPMAHYKNLRARYANGETTSLTVPLQELRKDVTPHASELLALIYQASGMSAYAADELEHTRQEAIATQDLNTLARASVLLAQNHYAADDYDAALKAITDIHLLTADQTADYTEGVIHLASGEPALAFEAFTRGTPVDELTPPRLLGAVIAAANTLDGENVTKHLRVYLTQLPEETLNSGLITRTAALAGAEFLTQAGEARLAASITAALDLTAFHPPELLQLGSIHYANTNYEAAAEAFQAVTRHPDAERDERLTALRNHAHALQADKQHEKAAALYEEYLNAAPYDTEALYHHGWALLHARSASDAKQAWKEAAARGYDPATTALKELPN